MKNQQHKILEWIYQAEIEVQKGTETKFIDLHDQSYTHFLRTSFSRKNMFLFLKNVLVVNTLVFRKTFLDDFELNNTAAISV